MSGVCGVTVLARRAASATLLALLVFRCTAAHARPPKAGDRSSASSTKPGRAGDVSARRAIAGGTTAEDKSMGAESADLAALREAERELFVSSAPSSAATPATWPDDVAIAVPDDGAPKVSATGLPPSAEAASALAGGASPGNVGPAPDLTWLDHLELPDLPVRWDPRVVRYLQFFRDDPAGRAMYGNLYRRSGRYRDMIRRVLRKKSLPEDLAFVAMVESGFDPTSHSPAGAAGLWQFMPETAKIYGLTVDRWLDQRMSATVATDAAASFLGDLHRRFGSWELALAGFNMGYVGLSSVVRRFDTNDFWALSRIEGAVPWETSLYVPRVIAVAIVAHNPTVFGLTAAADPPIETDDVEVAAGVPLALVAQASGCATKDVETLNPELRASRTPPAGDGPATYSVKVPSGKGPIAAQNLARIRRDQPPLDRYTVRFGETLEQIAQAHKTTSQKLAELNAMTSGEVLRGGTLILVPHVAAASEPAPAPQAGPNAPKTSVVVPPDVFVYPNRKRVFYRVVAGDTLREIAGVLRTSPDEIRQWNNLDPSARLQDGMTLQAFVPADADLSRIAVLTEDEVRVLAVGSDEFFAALEHDKGFKRVVVRAKANDTLEAVGKRFGVTPRTMERVNRRNRNDVLHSGDPVVVYVPTAGPNGAAIAAGGNAIAGVGSATADNGASTFDSGTPNGPLPSPPLPELLP
ncbi:MAG TPA: LysM peptidoglycan-binding domain-containing protein [Polyangiaceae bacterium]|nr:LysM peptidoglycan-binding domain-containing protein [Polyangiaceae bacterium]